MDNFKGIQKTFRYTQTNKGSLDNVFRLLCPVRERDWIDGWDCEMINSLSGFIENDCVFTTKNGDLMDTIWYVTQHDVTKKVIEFVKITPGKVIVRINIRLEPIDSCRTRSHISYQYTGLSSEQNELINSEMESSFMASMYNWEDSINYYLETGKKLLVNSG